eukprot:954560-Amphidinium_carterae.1
MENPHVGTQFLFILRCAENLYRNSMYTGRISSKNCEGWFVGVLPNVNLRKQVADGFSEGLANVGVCQQDTLPPTFITVMTSMTP